MNTSNKPYIARYNATIEMLTKQLAIVGINPLEVQPSENVGLFAIELSILTTTCKTN